MSRPSRTGALVEPNVDSGRIPGIRLVDDVELPVTIHISQLSLMPSITPNEYVVTEVAPTVAIEDPGRGVRVIDLRAAVPLSHLCCEDVQIPVAIDIADVQRVA